MDELGKIHQLLVPVGDYTMHFNIKVILMAWLVMGILIVFAFLATRKRSLVPGNLQLLGELFVTQLYALAEDALDKDLAKKYAPMICALFMFLAISNSLGIVPFLEEPTKDLNVPL